MKNQLIKKAQQETIAKFKIANTFTLISSIFLMVYGVVFSIIMPGITGTVTGILIAVFGLFIFSFSLAAKQNNK